MLHVAFATIFAVSFALTAADESRKFTRFKIEIPDGWHYKEVIDDKVESCFISVEDIDKEGKFSSGLSIIVRKDFKKKIN